MRCFRRACFIPLLALFPVLILVSQETPVEEKPSAPETFPLALVLEGAEFADDGNRAWRLDWPPELPPDAFKVKAGEVSRITVEGKGFSFAYSAEGGRIKEFPFMLDGRMARVSLAYANIPEESSETDFKVSSMSLTFPQAVSQNEGEETTEDTAAPADEPWELDFLEYRDSYPSLVRASCGDTWFFISLSRAGYEIMETWYDENGEAACAYGFSLVEIDKKLKIHKARDYSKGAYGSGMERHYDSRGFITETSGPDGLYKVLYFREDQPRYWERRPGENEIAGDGAGMFTFQWDDNNFLVRLSSRAFTEFSGLAGSNETDSRYEYLLDEKGNWIERRETSMIRAFNLLVPSPGTTVRRILEYKEQE
jgi:hypothetical protein